MITLTCSTSQTTDSGDTTVWAVNIVATVSQPETLPAEIFVYHAGMPSQPDQDFFSCVASPQQINELPNYRPDSDGLRVSPFYRQSTATLFCRTAAQAAQVWEDMQMELACLRENWTAANTLSLTATFSA